MSVHDFAAQYDAEHPRPPLLDVMAYKVSRENAATADTSWLIRGRWPADAYGVVGAEDKAGKTWSALDLAVSVVSGTPWLGSLEVDVQGPATLFLGEGGERGTVRRLEAIAQPRRRP